MRFVLSPPRTEVSRRPLLIEPYERKDSAEVVPARGRLPRTPAERGARRGTSTFSQVGKRLADPGGIGIQRRREPFQLLDFGGTGQAGEYRTAELARRGGGDPCPQRAQVSAGGAGAIQDRNQGFGEPVPLHKLTQVLSLRRRQR